MADICDRGSDRAQQMLDDSLAATLRRIQAESAQPIVDHEDCLDCGELIPIARREARPGVETCIGCQTLRERR